MANMAICKICSVPVQEEPVMHVDICLPEHEDTVAFGVRTAEVWVEEP